MAVRFDATIEIRGINPFVLVTAEFANEVRAGWRKAMPVLVWIDGKPVEPHRINMMPVGNGSFYLYLNGIVRTAAGVGVGDVVSVDIEFDESYSGGPQDLMPDWFEAALGANPLAQDHWNELTPSRQKEVLRYLGSLKSAEARERNLARVLGALAGKPPRYMARNWTDGW